jgi:predicted nucleic acid-binding protein
LNEVVVLDSDTLSELSRQNPRVVPRARAYLQRHGRLTFTAVSVFERVRGYQAAIAAGRPYESQLRDFQTLAAESQVLPLDGVAADLAGRIWAGLSPRQRRAVSDILIAAIAASHALPVVTRNRDDFLPIARLPFVELSLHDWAR